MEVGDFVRISFKGFDIMQIKEIDEHGIAKLYDANDNYITKAPLSICKKMDSVKTIMIKKWVKG